MQNLKYHFRLAKLKRKCEMFWGFWLLSPEPSEMRLQATSGFFSNCSSFSKRLQKSSNTLLLSSHPALSLLRPLCCLWHWVIPSALCGSGMQGFSAVVWAGVPLSAVSLTGVLPKPGLDVCGCHRPREGQLAPLHKLGPLREGAESLSSGDQQDHILQEFKGITVWTAATLLSFIIKALYSALLKNFFSFYLY